MDEQHATNCLPILPLFHIHTNRLPCRSVHLMLLCFNAMALKYLSSAFGVWKSVLAKKDNIRALLLVCSQVCPNTESTQCPLCQNIWCSSHCQNIWCSRSLQKALLIVVAVVEQLSGALGESGLLVLLCVAAHINQVPSLDLPSSTMTFRDPMITPFLIHWKWIFNPSITLPVMQVIMDSFLVNFWIQKEQLKKASIMSRSIQWASSIYTQKQCTFWSHSNMIRSKGTHLRGRGTKNQKKGLQLAAKLSDFHVSCTKPHDASNISEKKIIWEASNYVSCFWVFDMAVRWLYREISVDYRY